LTSGQAKSIFTTADYDKSGDLTDQEWNLFNAAFY